MPMNPSDMASNFSYLGTKSREHGGTWVYDPTGDEIVIKHRALPGTTTELFQRVKQLEPGTTAEPTRMRVTARLENQQDNVQQYIGFAEQYPSFYFNSIFFLDHHGTPRFVTHCDGESEVTEFPDLDMTEWKSYTVEWTNKPRVSLFIDEDLRAHHTESVPTTTLLRFAEIINEKDSGPDMPVEMRIDADKLFDEWI